MDGPDSSYSCLEIHIALHDGVVGGLMDTAGLHTQERGLEQGLGAPEPLISDGDHLSVRKLVRLLKAGAAGGGCHLLLEVESDVAELLLDVTDNFPLGGGGEAVASLGENLHQIVSEVTAGEIKPEDGVGESVTLVDGNSVGDTVSGVQHDAG